MCYIVNNADMRFQCSANDGGKRIDRLMRALFPHTPLSAISKAIRCGQIFLDNKKAIFSDRVSDQSIIDCRATFSKEARNFAPTQHSSHIIPIFEDDHLSVIYKMRGTAMTGNFINAIQSHYTTSRDLSFRPSPAHRLDRNTSGLLMISKTVAAARILHEFFQKKKIRKEYLALLEGNLQKSHVWNLALSRTQKKTHRDQSGKNALTIVSPIAKKGSYTLARCSIITGRTHQIRAHAAAYGYPLCGDIKYGGKKHRMGYFLHAYRIKLPPHPLFSQRDFTAPLRMHDMRVFETFWGKDTGMRKMLTDL